MISAFLSRPGVSIAAMAGRLARPRDWKRTKAVTAIVVAIAVCAIPAVAGAYFSSSSTATMTVSTGPLPPTGVTLSCASKKLTIAWTAPPGLLPTSYTLWISFTGKEPYTLLVKEPPVAGSRTSEEIAGQLLNDTVAIKAVYGSWTSGFSAPSNTIKC